MSMGSRFSQHSFAMIPSVNMARSFFDRSFGCKDTIDFDYLVPFFVDEILPGDTVNLNAKWFCRLATQVVPLLDNMYLDTYFFFVPNRLVWDNWERFNGESDDPSIPVDYLVPQVEVNTGTGMAVGTLWDKFGLPTGVDDLSVCAFPFRAYQLIWNDWFRDQNLQAKISIDKSDNTQGAGSFSLLKGAKKHDYFTSALPWPQKGDAVPMPMAGEAPVYGRLLTPTLDGHVWQTRDLNTNAIRTGAVDVLAGAAGPNRTLKGDNLAGTSTSHGMEFSMATPDQYALLPDSQPAYADLSEATSASINLFRQAMMMQSLLELDARGGTRYVEILRAHFNVISPDFRLQRPEFLGGNSVRIQQHPVAQTAGTGDGSDTPQANLAAFSTSALMDQRVGFTKSFVEHGWVLGLVKARGDVTYQQGVNRMWSRETRWDYFWPKLQELGEQAILKKEIYAQGTSADEEVWGYQERYAEYRYRPSEIKGQFRSTFAQTLDVWHLAEEFSSLPGLNSTFIQSNTPIERSLAVDSAYPHLLCDFWFDYKHARPMVTYGVPATLGRF